MKKLFFVLTLFLPQQLWAANIYVAPVQGTNVPENETKTLRELVKVQVQNESGHRLVDSLDKAEFFIQTKVIKFNTYTLSMTRWKGNQKVSSGQWKAKSSADLETQVNVAVGEILSTQNNKKQAVLFDNKKSLGEQAAEKQQRANYQRVRAKRQVTIGFGPAYFSNMNSSEGGIGFQFGYIWNIDDHFDLGLTSDFAISTEHSDAYMLSGKIVTNYFFASRDISPFVGAGFGYGWASVHDSNTSQISDDTATGFGLGLQAGVKFFRTSNVNFAVSGEYSQILNNSSLGQPKAFLLKFALLY